MQKHDSVRVNSDFSICQFLPFTAQHFCPVICQVSQLQNYEAPVL